jgi:hypothetical protein
MSAKRRREFQWDVDMNVTAPAPDLFDAIAGWFRYPVLLELASVVRHHLLDSDGRSEYFWLEVSDLPLKRTHCYGKRLLRRPDATVTIFTYRFFRDDKLAAPAAIEQLIEREWDSLFYHTVRITPLGERSCRLRAAEPSGAPEDGMPLTEIFEYYAELRRIAESGRIEGEGPRFDADDGSPGEGPRYTPPHEGDYDPYSVLGVRPDASMQTIKRAYRTLAFRWHPDRVASSGPAARRYAHNIFIDVASAYHAILRMRGL